MPTNQSEGTNQCRCAACGRYFNTEDELKTHARECVAAAQTGAPKPDVKGREEGDDREWVSTP